MDEKKEVPEVKEEKKPEVKKDFGLGKFANKKAKEEAEEQRKLRQERDLKTGKKNIAKSKVREDNRKTRKEDAIKANIKRMKDGGITGEKIEIRGKKRIKITTYKDGSVKERYIGKVR